MSSELLPTQVDQFGSQEYWDKFFVERKQKSFEWYGEYTDLQSVFDGEIENKNARILVVGCGNSELSAQMYDAGYHNITNMDFSPVAIEEMKQKNTERPHMKWEVMDVTQMTYDDGSFDVVLDKGTLDAIATHESEPVMNQITKMTSEISRVLSKPTETSPGGCYLCVTLAQDFVLHKLINCFHDGWHLRVSQVAASQTQTSPMVPFCFAIRSAGADKQDAVSTVYSECSMKGEVTLEQLKRIVTEVQRMNAARVEFSSYHYGKCILLNLCGIEEQDEASPRFTIYMIDHPNKHAPNGKCSVFIVPQGREHEWLFSTPEGQMTLVIDHIGFQRVLLVHLGRSHTFPNGLQGVQDELSGKITQLFPSDCNDKVPYMTIGTDIGERKEVFRTTSEFSGEIVVEDVSTNGKEVRRLVFMSNQNCIQSEALLKSNKKQIELGHLTCDHHCALVAGLTLVLPLFQRGSPVNVSVIGLGGGVFPMFLHYVWDCLVIDAVEIDPAIVAVARSSFQFQEDDRMTVHTVDGIEYIKEHKTPFEVLILDVDSKDHSNGISCPPEEFLADEFLRTVHDKLDDNGVFMINLVCRSSTLREETQQRICGIFKQVMVVKMERDVNSIIFAFKTSIRRPTEKKDIHNFLKELNKKAKRPVSNDSPIFEILEDLRLQELCSANAAVPTNKPTKKSNKKSAKKKKRR